VTGRRVRRTTHLLDDSKGERGYLKLKHWIPLDGELALYVMIYFKIFDTFYFSVKLPVARVTSLNVSKYLLFLLYQLQT
jgi:hypothetical protein